MNWQSAQFHSFLSGYRAGLTLQVSITHLAFRYRDLYTGLMLIHVQIGRRLPHTNRPPTCCTPRQSSGRCSSHTCRLCPAQPFLGAITRITPTPAYPEPVTAGPARHWLVRSCQDRWPACSAAGVPCTPMTAACCAMSVKAAAPTPAAAQNK